MNDSIPSSALAQHTAILGKTGSGKTSTGKLLIERVVAENARVCVLDPIKSDWWGVIASADGKSPGLPFTILGGPHGHVPLHSGAGAAIAGLVGSGQLPLSVIDMADFEPGGLQRFFVDFAPALMRSMRGVVYLVLEEAHEFAPKERAGIGQETMAIHYAKRFATAGRSKGIRLVVMTQRTQSLHNALLGSCETMIVHRLTAPADQMPVKQWLAANAEKDVKKQVEGSLANLRTGTAWVCSGEAQFFERIKFPRISTFDNTVTPKNDGKLVEVKGHEVDHDALMKLVGSAVDEAAATDPKKLQARIKDLKQQLKVAQGGSAPTYPDLRDENARLRAHIDEVECRITSLRNHFFDLADPLDAIRSVLTEPLEVLPPAQKQARVPQSARQRVNGQASSIAYNGEPMPEGPRRTLIAIAQAKREADSSYIAAVARYSTRSVTNYMTWLRSRGLVAEGWPAQITDVGLAALGDGFEPLPSGADLLDHWLGTLAEGPRRTLRALVEHGPLGNAELAERTEYSTRSVTNYTGALKRRKLIEKRGGKFCAVDELQP